MKPKYRVHSTQEKPGKSGKFHKKWKNHGKPGKLREISWKIIVFRENSWKIIVFRENLGEILKLSFNLLIL